MQTAAVVLSLAGILLGAAGRLDWPMAWAFLGVYVGFAVLAFVALDPALIRERSRPGAPSERWDIRLASVAFTFFLPLTLLVAGLDVGRFGWSPPLPSWVEIGALGLFTGGYAFAFWAMRVNRFFSTFVRIQTERGHRVVSEGPYACVRHPGYAGAILAALALPVALGSLLALLPASVGAALFALRTLREDRMLQARLDGYRAYARRVRWRLLPGVL
ncbi:MAG: isoprenylcysteine carboxylmethyltransferase family protein [Deltaproteobacteria bacterium]|nr:MAG: isoprenylcysteine carboxylmethyltransferase family protein [Deltaproteobacteria bacterium]